MSSQATVFNLNVWKLILIIFFGFSINCPATWAQSQLKQWPLSRSQDGPALIERLNSPFGPRIRPSDKIYELHPGIDLAGNESKPGLQGAPVYATADGTVDLLTDNTGRVVHMANEYAPENLKRLYRGGGRIVRLSHNNNLYTLYLHLSRQADTLTSQPGKQTSVRAGDLIGYVGKTGELAKIPHLHFEVRDGGTKQVYAKNPLGYLPRKMNHAPVISAMSVKSLGQVAKVSVDIENIADGCVQAADCDIDLNWIVLKVKDSAGVQLDEKIVDFNHRINAANNNPKDHITITPIKHFNRNDTVYRWTITFNNVAGVASGIYEVEATDVLGLSAKRSNPFQIRSSALTLPFVSLSEFIKNLTAKTPGSNTDCFISPTETEMADFQSGLQKLLLLKADDDTHELESLLKNVNYDLNVLNVSADKFYWVAQERGSHSRKHCKKPFRGLGTYVVDPGYDPKRNIIIEVPHPIFDSDTPNEGAKILQGLNARAMFITGTHRCANRDSPSECSGETKGCRNHKGNKNITLPARESDTGHSVKNFFFSAHLAGMQLLPKPVFLNLHGNQSEKADITISNGTISDTTSPTAPDNNLVNKLRDELLNQGVKVISCSHLKAGQKKPLCGTDNVLGRLSNGVEPMHSCKKDAEKASGLFLHIEQRRKPNHLDLRKDPSKLIKALTSLF